MKKNTIRLITVVLTAILLTACIFSVPTSATGKNQIPFDSYTYWTDELSNSKASVYNRSIYEVKTTLLLSELCADTLPNKITDICKDNNGRLYILDGGNSRVIVLDNGYTFSHSFGDIKKNDEFLNYTDAGGIFVSDEGEIYIADTEHKRVIVCDANGAFIKEILLPDSRLIPSNFAYRPIKVVKDSRDYLYVLSDGSYYGAILYSPDGEFLGFYGANTVKTSLGSAIANYVKKMFMTNEQRAQLETSLPYQFTDLCVDKNDFIYTTTGNTAKDKRTAQTGQIRKLNPGGIDVLNSDDINFGDPPTGDYSQDILSVDIDDDGYIYALDSSYGHIFVYDQYNNTMGVFGCGTRQGVQDGSFTDAVAITVNGTDVLVADAMLNSISVFTQTEYGKVLKKAQLLTNAGKYTEAQPLWEELYQLDKQNQLIYIGLAKAYYEAGDYDKALSFAKQGKDRDTYALAFAFVRNEFLSKNFTILAIVAVTIIALFILLLRFKKKKGIILFPENIRTAIAVLRKPLDTFSLIKQKKNGSVKVAIGILILYYISAILSEMYSGFCYTSVGSDFNALLTLMRTGGIVILFTVCFWAVSTLMHGQGKMHEIFIVICYSLQPLIIANAIYLILTNIMLPSEIAFLDIFMTIMTLYTTLLLCFGLMKVSDYEFGTFLGATLLSLAGVVIVLFIGIVIFLLLQLLWGFVTTVYSEIYKIVVFGG